MSLKPDLSSLYDKLNLASEARRLVEQVRRAPPGRAVGGGRGNVHGDFPSPKMGHTLQYESGSPELPYLIQAEHDRQVVEVYCQPPARLKHVLKTAAGRNSAYFEQPDFLEIGNDGIFFVNCKRESELVQFAAENPNRYVRDESGNWGCPSGEAAAASYGLKYKVVTSSSFNSCLLRNTEFLDDYLRAGSSPTPATLERLEKLFAGNSYIHLPELIDLIGSADEIYRAICVGAVYFELETERIALTHSAIVFRDRTTAVAYRCVMQHRCFDPTPLAETLVLRTGESVTWDGVAWVVLNTGIGNITLQRDDDVATLPKDIFFKLVRSGQIKGTSVSRDPRYEAGLKRLLEASPQGIEEGVRRYQLIQPYLEDYRAIGLTISGAESSRMIGEYLGRWREGKELYLDPFINLIPHWSERGNRLPKLPERALLLAKAVIRKYWLRKKAPSKIFVWNNHLKRIAKRLGLPVCSEKTFYQLCKLVPIEEAAQARHGHKAAYQVAGPLWEGDPALFARHGERAFAVAHIDHTPIDVEFLSTQRRVNLGKAWLTLLIDANSRVTLACYLSFDRPSYVACMMVMRVCVARHGRLPSEIVCDQGKEFKCGCFRRLMARYGKRIKWRPAFKPRFGTIVERAFGNLNTRFFNNLEGNTQNSKTPRQSARTHDPATQAVWTAPRLFPHLERFLYEILPQLDHFGLLRSPRSLFDESMTLHGQRDEARIVYSEVFIVDSMPTPRGEDRKIHARVGIKTNYLTYWSEEFRNPKIIGTKVKVKFDPFDAGYILAYVKGQWVHCDCSSTLFREMHVAEIEWAVCQIKAEARRTGRNYRVTTEAVENFFLTLIREENELKAEKRRLLEVAEPAKPSESATRPRPESESDDGLLSEPDMPQSEARPRRRLKSTKIESQGTSA